MVVRVLCDAVELCLHSLLMLCAGSAFVEPLAGVCFCASYCDACGFPRRVLPQVPFLGLRNLSGSICLSCSCGGAMSVGFVVSLMWRLFSALCRALTTAPAVLRSSLYRRLPLGVPASFLPTSACQTAALVV